MEFRVERQLSTRKIFAAAASITALCFAMASHSPAIARNNSGPEVGSSTEQVTCLQSSHPRVKAQIKIYAPPDEVFRCIHEARLKDPDLVYSRVVEQISPTQCKLEQKFDFLPFIGSSVCLMYNTEVPNQRIDYHLIKSDHFKEMAGSWVLTPLDNGQVTQLELFANIDMGLPLPKSFMNSFTSKRLHKRLVIVKTLAESHTVALSPPRLSSPQ